MTSTPITNRDDIIDSRDVIERIEELEEGYPIPSTRDLLDQTYVITPGNREAWKELATLKALASKGSDYSSNWPHGTTLIRDTYFQEYAQELAEDCGDIPSAGSSRWPLYCIDWKQAARELQHDYTSIDFDGVTYWVR